MREIRQDMVHFVGAGPGAEDLITLRGAELLREADIVIYAGSLVNPGILGLCKENARLYDSARLSLSEVIEIIAKAEGRSLTGDASLVPAGDGNGAKSQVSIVRLHSGDPGLYGAIREQIDELKRLGIDFDITPGVSSFNAAAAALQSEYTVAGVSQSVIITRMEGRTAVPQGEKLSSLAAHGATMVIFLSMGLVKEVQEELLKGGAYNEDTPAAIVYRVTWKEERVFRCRLSQLYETAKDNGITRTALMIVGNFLGDSYEKSKLYAEDFSTGFRRGLKAGGIRLIAFTDRGEGTARLIRDGLSEPTAEITVSRGGEDTPVSEWVRRYFYEADALIFVGAAGIAVRAVAPFVESKAYDPAVIAVDEYGKNVIPLLSGHLGGANRMSARIAGITGGNAVITTATDINASFAVDSWAAEQGLKVINPEYIKVISSAVLRGESIVFESLYPILPEGRICFGENGRRRDNRVRAAEDGLRSGRYRYLFDGKVFKESYGEHKDGKAAENAPSGLVVIDVTDSDRPCLKLCPKTGYLGIGCRRGVKKEQLEEVFRDFVSENRLLADCIQGASSIDIKREESGLKEFCSDHGLALRFYSAEELNGVEGEFSSSEFVKDTTGVDCVCERCAALSCGNAPYIRKYAREGVTFSLGVR